MTRTVIKQLATLEDLAIGSGKVAQERNGQVHQLSRIMLPKFVTSTAELASVDTTKYTVAAKFDLTTKYAQFYKFDTATRAWVALGVPLSPEWVTVINNAAAGSTSAVAVANQALIAANTAVETAETAEELATSAEATADAVTLALALYQAATDDRLDALEDAVALTATPISRARLTRTTDLSLGLTGGEQHVAVPWQAAEQTGLAVWDLDVPTLIVVPVGATKMRVSACSHVRSTATFTNDFDVTYAALLASRGGAHSAQILAVGVAVFTDTPRYSAPVVADLAVVSPGFVKHNTFGSVTVDTGIVTVVPGEQYKLDIGTHAAATGSVIFGTARVLKADSWVQVEFY